MDRNEAYQLLTEHTKKEGLIKHALAVEAATGENLLVDEGYIEENDDPKLFCK